MQQKLPFSPRDESDSPGPEQKGSNPQTPNLAFSRENTPYLGDEDHLNQSNGGSAATSDTEHSGEEAPKPSTLDISRAKLKRPLDAPVKREYKKKAYPKLLEKLWIPLDREALSSFEELSKNAVKKVIERLADSSNRQAKAAETERVLAGHWTSDLALKSFTARLKMTRLPLLRSLQIRARDSLDETFKALDPEVVRQRQKMLEAHLRAELKELAKLEAYYTSTEKQMLRDREGLVELKETATRTQRHYKEVISENREKYKLQQAEGLEHKNILLVKELIDVDKSYETSGAVFHPDTDPEVSALLQQIQGGFAAVKLPFSKMHEYLEHLSILEQQIHANGHV